MTVLTDSRHNHQSIYSSEVVWIAGTKFVSPVTQPTSASPIEIPSVKRLPLSSPVSLFLEGF